VRFRPVGGNVGFPPFRPDGFTDLWNDVEPDANEIVFLHARELFGGSKVLVALFSQDKRMEHSTHLHPDFGLLSPTPRLRRELRIAASFLLFGGIAGALGVSGVIALRHSDRAAMEIAEAPRATASSDATSRESESGSGPSTDARAATDSESNAGTAPRPQASADVPAQTSSETSAPPTSAIAPKPRMVRIRKAVDSPAIARLPLGRSEAPATAAPPGDAHESTQASNAPAGSDVPAAAPEKAGVRPGAREAVANSSPPKKKVQKTVRTASSRRDDVESDSFWRGERTDDWSTRPAAPAGADVPGVPPEKAVIRMGAREALVDSSPPKTVRNGSSRRNDTGSDPFWRDERTDDWSARRDAPASADAPTAMPEKAAPRTGAREALADPSPPKKASKTVRNASSRRNDAGNDSFFRDDRQDDWNARAAPANDARNPVGRANAREAASSLRGFWEWSR
jgi:hypothetical protein